MANNSIHEKRSGVIIFTIICNLALLMFAIYLWIEEDGIEEQEFLTFSGLTILPLLNLFVLSKYTTINLKNLSREIYLYLRRLSKSLKDTITSPINANKSLKGIYVSLGIYTVIYLVFKKITQTTMIV